MSPVTKLCIIVPAHNAADHLGRCLDALLADGIARESITVVDDASTDGTAEIAKTRGIAVIRRDTQGGPGVARNTGVAATRAPLILFVDADVAICKGTQEQILSAFEDENAPDAVFGSYDDAPDAQRLVSRYRNLLHHHTHQTGNRDAESFWTGIGAIRRRCFVDLGGFDPRLRYLEDVELGRRAADAGYPVHCFAGRGSISFRMYPDGVHQLVDGWTKNFALGAASAGTIMVLLVTAWMAGAGVASRLLVAGSLAQTTPRLLLGLAAYVLYVVQIHWMQVRIGNFGLLSAILYPFTLLFFMVIFIRSLQLTWLKQTVRWKGRDITV